MVVKDAFGKTLKAGDEIAWISYPSLLKEMRRGIILQIEECNYKPTIIVKPLQDSYAGSGKNENICRLVHCWHIGRYTRRRVDNFRFPRVVKL